MRAVCMASASGQEKMADVEEILATEPPSSEPGERYEPSIDLVAS